MVRSDALEIRWLTRRRDSNPVQILHLSLVRVDFLGLKFELFGLVTLSRVVSVWSRSINFVVAPGRAEIADAQIT